MCRRLESLKPHTCITKNIEKKSPIQQAILKSPKMQRDPHSPIVQYNHHQLAYTHYHVPGTGPNIGK